MRPPSPRQVVLARYKEHPKFTLSTVAVPRIEATLQKNTTKFVGRVRIVGSFLC